LQIFISFFTIKVETHLYLPILFDGHGNVKGVIKGFGIAKESRSKVRETGGQGGRSQISSGSSFRAIARSIVMDSSEASDGAFTMLPVLSVADP
jgi:hypothetical protein